MLTYAISDESKFYALGAAKELFCYSYWINSNPFLAFVCVVTANQYQEDLLKGQSQHIGMSFHDRNLCLSSPCYLFIASLTPAGYGYSVQRLYFV